MKHMEFVMSPRMEDGHLELQRVPVDHGWKKMYAALDYEGRLATSLLSTTALFEDKDAADKYIKSLEGGGRMDVWREAVETNGHILKMPRDGDLTLPLLEPAREVALKVLKTALKVLEKTPSTGGCRSFYTPAEWEEHQKVELGNNARLVVVHDGGEFGYLMSYDKCMYDLMDAFSNELEKEGYWTESGTSWWTVIYPVEKDGE